MDLERTLLRCFLMIGWMGFFLLLFLLRGMETMNSGSVFSPSDPSAVFFVCLDVARIYCSDPYWGIDGWVN